MAKLPNIDHLKELKDECWQRRAHPLHTYPSFLARHMTAGGKATFTLKVLDFTLWLLSHLGCTYIHVNHTLCEG